jgi:nucleoside-diphosphate-sugar epimerase
MKIAITGHTSGLGKAIYTHFEKNGYEIIGLSRSNGFSIPEKLQEVVNIAKTCDLFFNNVHIGTTQSDFIKNLFKDTMIVTSGSMGADSWQSGNPYYIEKFQIENTHKSYRIQTPMAMLLLKMGYLENYTDRKSIPYSQIINSIEHWLKNPRITMIEFGNIK